MGFVNLVSIYYYAPALGFIMEFKYVKIVVFTPVSHSDKIREVLAESGAGYIGNYDYCSFSTKGTGRFRGGDEANPYLGEKGKIEEVDEERIETICPADKMESVLKAVKDVHPYEEPAIDIYPLLNP